MSLQFDLLTEVMGIFLENVFWENIYKMLFFSICLVFYPAVPCRTHFGWQEHWDAGHIYERNYWTSRVDMKQLEKDYTVREQKDALHELEKLYKERSTVVRKHNGAFCSWPPVLPFYGKDVCQSGESVPCCPSAKCCLSLHCGSALNQSTYTVHFHRFLLCPICTLNSISLKPVRFMYFSF